MFTNVFTRSSGEIEIIPYLEYTNKNEQKFNPLEYNTEPPYQIIYPPILYYSSDDIIIVNE